VPTPPWGYWAYCPHCGAILIDPAARRRYAGFWRRFAGYWIDYAIVTLVGVILIVGGTWFGADDASAVFMALLIGGVIDFVYKLIGNARGATLGKAAVGIRVVGLSGDAPGLKRSLSRYLMSLVSGIGVSLGYFAMIWDPDKQTWHDGVAGTFVVRRR
jgi:uncharacterized RDD family membrane protein YckC